jgi:uncharacterized membrane protein YciS (DUF1049 family)
MLKKVAVLAITTTTVSVPAQAEVQIVGGYIWFMNENGSWTGYSIVAILFVLGLLLAICKLVEWLSSYSNSCDTSEEDAASNQAQRYEEEARRLRALKYKTDAATELTASLIEQARINAAYKELNQITNHDREVRRLSRRT